MSGSFAMKDLGPTKQILGIWITKDRASKKLYMLQKQYIENVLKRFNMDHAKVVGFPIVTHFNLSMKQTLL